MFRVRDEIFGYRVTEGTSISAASFVTPEYDEQGRAYVEFQVGMDESGYCRIFFSFLKHACRSEKQLKRGIVEI